VSPAEAQRLVATKSARTYTTAKQDILEANLHHLEKAAEMYDLLSRRASWTTVQCFDPSRKAMRTPDAIAADVLAAVEPVLDSQLTSHARKDGR
jgi:hypothetical protein